MLPNAWDAASASVFAAVGFPAIATTSGGVAASLGYGDREQAPVDEMMAAAARIARAVDVPVTIDAEAGYGLSPEAIVEAVVAAGGAGLNLEDSDYRAGGLVDAERHAELLGAVGAAARSAGVSLFVNARIDVFLRGEGEPARHADDALHRARLYRAAGADCVYPIGLGDERVIARLVDAAGMVNVNVKSADALPRVAALGVRRVTFGSALFRQAATALRGVADEIWTAAHVSGSAHDVDTA